MKQRKKKKLPPGQRLIRYFALALSIVCATSVFIPVGTLISEPELRPQNKPALKLSEPFILKDRLSRLEERVQELGKQPKLRLGAFVVEPESGKHMKIAADDSFAAASMIKVPVLVSLLKAIDEGKVDRSEVLRLREDLIGGGSGFLQWRPVNSKVSLEEAMQTMIVFSDNTATNLIIDRLGGKDILNRQYAFWGLKRTYIANWLPDLDGTNRTSPMDLCKLLARVDKGEILSKQSRSCMLEIMEKTRIKTLLPAGLPPGTKISHKTGDIGSLVGDCGIITSPEGKRIIACVQVERPHNDRRANELIRQVSKECYSRFSSDSSSIETNRVHKKARQANDRQ